MALKIRRRSRLRRKEATDFLGRLADEFGMDAPLNDAPLYEAEAGPHRLLLRGNDAIAIFLDGGIAPTIRGLLAFPAKKRAVTVDMGAVRFIYNGADVMAPGIVDADPGIRAADIVWVRDEKNGRPLAIGRAIMDGPTMAREEKGKAIQTIHHAGDELTMAVREFQRVEAASVHEGMRAYPGIREALASLAAWKLAAVTNKRHDTSVEALRVTGLLPFFALVLGGDSVPRKKPAPD